MSNTYGDRLFKCARVYELLYPCIVERFAFLVAHSPVINILVKLHVKILISVWRDASCCELQKSACFVFVFTNSNVAEQRNGIKLVCGYVRNDEDSLWLRRAMLK